jgi:peroxiredoxin Q/BCP
LTINSIGFYKCIIDLILIRLNQDAKLADQFNIPDGYQFHGQIVHYPALALLNEKGEEVFRYVGKNNSDRFSFDRLKAKVEELNGN